MQLPTETLIVARREVDRAILLERQASVCFSKGNFQEAYDLCTQALHIAPALAHLRNKVEMLKKLRVDLLCTRASICLQRGWLLACVADCSSCIAEAFLDNDLFQGEDGANIRSVLQKVLVDRAQAWQGLGFETKARSDLLEVVRDPTSRSASNTPVIRWAEEALRQLHSNTCLPCQWSWEHLPDESQARVAMLVPIVALGRLSSTNRGTRVLTQQPRIWQQQMKTVLGPMAQAAGSSSQLKVQHSVGRKGGVCGDHWFVKDRTSKGRHYTFVQRQPRASEKVDYEEIMRRQSPNLWIPATMSILGKLPPVVVDVGTGYTKVGFAGAVSPISMVPNMAVLGNATVMKHGMFTEDMELMEHFMRRAVFGPLGARPEQHATLLCLNLYPTPADSEIHMERVDDLQECLTQRLGVPVVCAMHSAVLALHAHGVTTGIVVDIGLGVTRVTPVINGEVQWQGITMEWFGAANCTNYLLQVLHHKLESVPIEDISGFQLMMMVKSTKEELGYVAANSSSAAKGAAPRVELKVISEALKFPVHLDHELAIVGEMFFNPAHTGPHHSYFGPRAPAPINGLHKLILNAVALCPAGYRRMLLENVVLAGGTSTLPGMRDRLEYELQAKVKADPSYNGGSELKPAVARFLPEPSWLGGSLMAAGVACQMLPSWQSGLSSSESHGRWSTESRIVKPETV